MCGRLSIMGRMSGCSTLKLIRSRFGDRQSEVGGGGGGVYIKMDNLPWFRQIIHLYLDIEAVCPIVED